MPSGRELTPVWLAVAVVLLWSPLQSGCVVVVKSGNTNSSTGALQQQYQTQQLLHLQRQQKQQQFAREQYHLQLNNHLNSQRQQQQQSFLRPPKYQVVSPSRFPRQRRDQKVKEQQQPEVRSDSSETSESAGDYLLPPPVEHRRRQLLLRRSPVRYHGDNRFRALSKRYQRRPLKQKRHTLLALVRAAIPYASPSASNHHLPLRNLNPSPLASPLLATLPLEEQQQIAQQQYLLSQQQQKQQHDSLLQEEQQYEKPQYQDDFEQYQDPKQQLLSVGQVNELLGSSETALGPWLRKRSGVGVGGSSNSLVKGVGGSAGNLSPLGVNVDSSEPVEGEGGGVGGGGEDNGSAIGDEDVAAATLVEGDAQKGDESPGRKNGGSQEEVNSSLQQVGNSINSAFFRSSRSGGARPYDVPQIECPPAEDKMERFPCPSPDRMGRYRCIDDHLLCDGFIDCPDGEDEDREQCMFYKTTKAHLDILADAIFRWARGRK